MNADFLSIALEEYESNSYDVACEFVDDVRVNLRNANRDTQARHLKDALQLLERGEHERSRELVGDVYQELLAELENHD